MNIDFFIKRPIFTSVCSFIFILAGLICIPLLPVSQYPELAPPLITVSSVYTGANSEVVETAVTTPLEEAINGVEDMRYMMSQSSNDGSSVIQVTFELGKDKDIAAVDVNNRISSVLGTLPSEVQKTGISISKKSTSIVGAYAFYTENNEYDDVFISNYIDKYVSDAIKRIDGVGDVMIAGERKYSMRVWVYPDKLSARGLTATDIVNVIEEQNVQTPAGQIGGQPSPPDGKVTFSLTVDGRLSSPEEFENLVVKTGKDGSLIRMKDVARIELGSEDYSTVLRYSGKPAIGVMVYQLADANALKVFEEVEAMMADLSKTFPPGLKYSLAFETTSVVEESIHEVVFTLFLSIFLVVLVIFFFLQSWRSTLIPIITIPVSLIGTFAILKLFGFSINTLSLFGIVLATGLVVDDAIVVIENIQRNITENNLSPIEAASASMKEVASAVIAATLVLAAVFLPVACFPGTTGQLYKQFALTIVFSVAISLFNALTLTPALSAILLRGEEDHEGSFFGKVEKIITTARDKYHAVLTEVIHYKVIAIIAFMAMLGGTYYLFQIVPSGFVPDEDQGYLITNIQAPEGTSLNYTDTVMGQVEQIMLAIPETRCTFAIGGYGFTGNGPNKAVVFTSLKPIKERKKLTQSAKAVLQKIRKQVLPIPDAIIMPFEPPAIQGIGNVGGFQFELLDQGGHTLNELNDVADDFIAEGNKSPILQGLFTSFSADNPQLELKLDRLKAKRLNILLSDIFTTLQVFLGSKYINDFNYIERVYRVYVQADSQYRDDPKDVKEFYVRSQLNNELIRLSSLIDINPTFTADTITHFNLYRSVELNGSSAPGYSSGQALIEMQNIANSVLPVGFNYQWAGISLEQLKSGQAGILMFALGLLFVYLVLAAQYESLIDPLIIILAVPLAIFGALLAQLLRGLENDVFCQIGLVMLIGLACKNSILIVEFANHLIRQGETPIEAVLEAAKTRFRPIMMTSLAFICGIFPLAVATGAGAASRNSMGTAVFGGMFFSTLLSLFIVPILFLVAKSIEHKIHNRKAKKDQ